MKLHQQLRLFYLAIGALLFGLFSVWIMHPRPKSADPLSPPPQATTRTTVAGSGLIEPCSQNLAIANPVSGVITSVAVKPHDHVKTGDILFGLETRHLEAELVRARATHTAAQASAGEAQMKLSLLEGISDPRAIRKEELETRRFEVERTQAEVAQALAEVNRLEVEIERQLIRAPIEGEILRVEARPGEYAPAGRLDPPLIVMGDTSRLHVRADLPEDLAWRVTAQKTATASPRGRGNQRIPLELIRVEPYVRPKQSLTGNPDERVDTRVAQMIYALPAGTPDLLVGQQVDIYISTSPQTH